MNKNLNKELINYILSANQNIAGPEFSSKEGIILNEEEYSLKSARFGIINNEDAMSVIHLHLDEFDIFSLQLSKESPSWIISNLDFNYEILYAEDKKFITATSQQKAALLFDWERFRDYGWAWYPAEPTPRVREVMEKFLENA